MSYNINIIIYLATLFFWVVLLSEYIFGRNLFTFWSLVIESKHHPGCKINIKLGENRIGVLCSWNYLKMHWAEELKDRCSSM